MIIVLFLIVGYVLYRAKWPHGFLPFEPDAERERTRRVGRRRVAPLPRGGGDEP
jgi:hypothetical protein